MYILLRICLFQVGYTCVSMVHGYDFVAQLRILYLRVSSPQRFRWAYLFSLFFFWGGGNRDSTNFWVGWDSPWWSRVPPGWDKIFYFVGTNTFSRKFCPKQRESDATESVQKSGNLGIRYVVYKFIFIYQNNLKFFP